jgi:glycosyltransferase involved in cell wall biosynthesis
VIVSTTITNSRADVIGAALASVAPEVDACIVIDTGANDETLAIAQAVLGPKLVVVQWPWRNDFAAARNFALDYAKNFLRGQQVGGPPATIGHNSAADWIIQADTDEWLRIPNARAILAAVPADLDVVMVPHATRTYAQCRCFRATTQGRWAMPVHEYFTPHKSVRAPEGWEFECQPRPNEDRTAKYTHYRAVLEGLVEREPENARAFYYLGDTLSILGYKGGAIKAFARCAALPGWGEQASWACYRAAILQFELGLPDYAIRTCQAGIQRSPHMAELHWLAGWVHYQTQNWAAAEVFAEAALKVGAGAAPRGGFCNPMAQRELPEQLLRYARAQLAGAPIEGCPKPEARRVP